MIWWTAAAYACQSTYGCYFDPRSIGGSEVAPGEAVLFATDRRCWDSATWIDAAGVEAAAEEIVTGDDDVLAWRVPAAAAPGAWTLRISSGGADGADVPLMVVAPREPAAGGLGALTVSDGGSSSGNFVTWGCSEGPGWSATGEVVLDGNPGPNWMVRFEPAVVSRGYGTWVEAAVRPARRDVPRSPPRPPTSLTWAAFAPPCTTRSSRSCPSRSPHARPSPLSNGTPAPPTRPDLQPRRTRLPKRRAAPRSALPPG